MLYEAQHICSAQLYRLRSQWKKGKSGISLFHFFPFVFFHLIFPLFLYQFLLYFRCFLFIFALFFSILFCTSSFCFPFIPALRVRCLFFLFSFFTSPLLASVFLSFFAFAFLRTFLPRCACYFWDGSEVFTAADTRRLWDRILYIIA